MESSEVANVLVAAEFGDLRLSLRLARLADGVAAAPGVSLPRALGSSAALEGAYRFLSNGRVTPEKILEPHVVQTMIRAQQAKRALMIHDTTWTRFSGETGRGFPRTTHGGHGFGAHVTLAAGVDGEPFGVAAMSTVMRHQPAPGKKKRATYGYKVRRQEMENDRWLEQILSVERRCAGRGKLIHVGDREADRYKLFATLLAERVNFVIRARKKRLVDDGIWLDVAARKAPLMLERDVPLAVRRKSMNGTPTYKPRNCRTATLSISATATTMLRTWGVTAKWPKNLPLNLVRVFEKSPPKGEEPVEWLILTSLPVATQRDVEFVVDCYRRRWLIEEFFKAVKTGCGYQKLQLESPQTLLNMLAVVLPIAAQMLRLRYLSRDTSHRNRRALSTPQLAVLRLLCPKLPSRPTADEALLAIAGLGGHIKNNGPPGWLTLYRGFERLTLGELVWRAKM